MRTGCKGRPPRYGCRPYARLPGSRASDRSAVRPHWRQTSIAAAPPVVRAWPPRSDRRRCQPPLALDPRRADRSTPLQTTSIPTTVLGERSATQQSSLGITKCHTQLVTSSSRCTSGGMAPRAAAARRVRKYSSVVDWASAERRAPSDDSHVTSLSGSERSLPHPPDSCFHDVTSISTPIGGFPAPRGKRASALASGALAATGAAKCSSSAHSKTAGAVAKMPVATRKRERGSVGWLSKLPRSATDPAIGLAVASAACLLAGG
jgi:hypothetical protein